MFYVLVCRECDDPEHPVALPFSSPEDRGRWASLHKAGTGHDRWFVVETAGRLTTEDLIRMISAHDQVLRDFIC